MSEHVLDQYIAKIEGHGKLKYSSRDGLVRVEIDEGERLFEKLVLGQSFRDIGFITARICGVCPTAHILAATSAVENAFSVETNDAIKNLRRALLAGQIIQSHALHAFFLALPDYIGINNALDINEKNPELFKIATKLKGVGDEIITLIGGRPVHPVTPTVGGFLTVPDDKSIEKLISKVRSAQAVALESLDLFAHLNYPYLKRKTEYFALSKNDKIDILGDTLVSSDGVEVSPSSYQFVITEKVKSYSTAKFAEHNGHGMLVGALARVNMMEESDFHPKTEKAIKAFGIKIPMINGYKNNLAQAIEILNFLELTEHSLTEYLFGRNMRTKVGFKIKEGVGVGAIEAPRGTLYHMYEFDKKGIVRDCDIITPTVQNLTNLEDDANAYIKQNKSVNIPRRERELEMLVRAYDPCITCSVH